MHDKNNHSVLCSRISVTVEDLWTHLHSTTDWNITSCISLQAIVERANDQNFVLQSGINKEKLTRVEHSQWETSNAKMFLDLTRVKGNKQSLSRTF